MSVAEQGMLMTSMLKRMDRYYPLLCDQAAVIKLEYQVIASSSVAAMALPIFGCM
jgi:hypothetical protein